MQTGTAIIQFGNYETRYYFHPDGNANKFVQPTPKEIPTVAGLNLNKKMPMSFAEIQNGQFLFENGCARRFIRDLGSDAEYFTFSDPKQIYTANDAFLALLFNIKDKLCPSQSKIEINNYIFIIDLSWTREMKAVLKACATYQEMTPYKIIKSSDALSYQFSTRILESDPELKIKEYNSIIINIGDSSISLMDVRYANKSATYMNYSYLDKGALDLKYAIADDIVVRLNDKKSELSQEAKDYLEKIKQHSPKHKECFFSAVSKFYISLIKGRKSVFSPQTETNLPPDFKMEISYNDVIEIEDIKTIIERVKSFVSNYIDELQRSVKLTSCLPIGAGSFGHIFLEEIIKPLLNEKDIKMEGFLDPTLSIFNGALAMLQNGMINFPKIHHEHLNINSDGKIFASKKVGKPSTKVDNDTFKNYLNKFLELSKVDEYLNANDYLISDANKFFKNFGYLKNYTQYEVNTQDNEDLDEGNPDEVIDKVQKLKGDFKEHIKKAIEDAVKSHKLDDINKLVDFNKSVRSALSKTGDSFTASEKLALYSIGNITSMGVKANNLKQVYNNLPDQVVKY